MEATYATTIGAARLVLRGLGLRITVEGDDRVPRTGPVVLAANHVSFLDFVLVGLAARRSGRSVRFLARHEVWDTPLVGRAMTAMRHVPVDRAAPAAAYLHARRLLREGEAVGVFPEAGISTSFTVRGLLPGAVALARDTGTPLLPVAIWGPQRVATAFHRVDLRRGRPVSISVGRPYEVAAGADVAGEVNRLGGALQRMLDELQGRPEHRPPPASAPGGTRPTSGGARRPRSGPGSSSAPSIPGRRPRRGAPVGER